MKWGIFWRLSRRKRLIFQYEISLHQAKIVSGEKSLLFDDSTVCMFSVYVGFAGAKSFC
jgi:hypothetical protein